MRHKGAILFWVDVLNALLMAALVATASILKWVLPHGMGPGAGARGGGGGWGMGRGPHGGQGAAEMIWGWTRHDWGDVHFWIAVALISGILIHLLLNFGWIKVSAARYLVPPFFQRASRRAAPLRV